MARVEYYKHLRGNRFIGCLQSVHSLYEKAGISILYKKKYNIRDYNEQKQKWKSILASRVTRHASRFNIQGEERSYC